MAFGNKVKNSITIRNESITTQRKKNNKNSSLSQNIKFFQFIKKVLLPSYFNIQFLPFCCCFIFKNKNY